jgi:hypothetical protein
MAQNKPTKKFPSSSYCFRLFIPITH